MASDLELKTFKEEAEEALDGAEWLLEELAEIGMGNEMNADTLRWLIPQVKDGMRRTGCKPHLLKKDKDAVAVVGALRDTVEMTTMMLKFFEEENQRLREQESAVTHTLPKLW